MSRKPRNILAHAVLTVGAVVMVSPFLWQILMSLSTNQQVTSVPPTFWPDAFHWENYREVFERLPFLRQFWVSIAVTFLRVLGQVILCPMAAYAFARMRFPLKGALLVLVLSITMVPPQIYLIPQVEIIQRLNLLDTIWGIALPGFFSAFSVFLMRQVFLGMPPELEEAARLDGANPIRIYLSIMLPLARPGLSALIILTTLWSWNDLLWPLVVTTYSENVPLSVGLASLANNVTVDYTVMMAASLMAIAPIAVLFIALQRRVMEGLAFAGLKG